MGLEFRESPPAQLSAHLSHADALSPACRRVWASICALPHADWGTVFSTWASGTPWTVPKFKKASETTLPRTTGGLPFHLQCPVLSATQIRECGVPWPVAVPHASPDWLRPPHPLRPTISGWCKRPIGHGFAENGRDLNVSAQGLRSSTGIGRCNWAVLFLIQSESPSAFNSSD